MTLVISFWDTQPTLPSSLKFHTSPRLFSSALWRQFLTSMLHLTVDGRTTWSYIEILENDCFCLCFTFHFFCRFTEINCQCGYCRSVAKGQRSLLQRIVALRHVISSHHCFICALIINLCMKWFCRLCFSMMTSPAAHFSNIVLLYLPHTD